MHKTIFSKDFKLLPEDNDFHYQKDLTNKLDNISTDFNQDILNEIVLWKVNRFAPFSDQTIDLINSINASDTEMDERKLRIVLESLLKTKGVQLAMASTILRFKNPTLFQIIDQRMYRIIYPDKNLKLSTYLSEKNIKSQINKYVQYLKDLKIVCKELKIAFEKSDRILFMADRRINKNQKLKNY